MTRRYSYRWTFTVARALKLARLDSGLSVIAIGVALGVSENTVRRYERGDTEPPGWAIDRWLQKCGMSYRLTIAPTRELEAM